MTSPLSALSETSTEYSNNYAIAHLEKGQSFGSVGTGSQKGEKVELTFPVPTRSWNESGDLDIDIEKGQDQTGLTSVQEITEEEDDRSEVKATAI